MQSCHRPALLLIATLFMYVGQETVVVSPAAAQKANQAGKKNQEGNKNANNKKKTGAQSQGQIIEVQRKQIQASIGAAKKAIPLAQGEAQDAQSKWQAAEARAQELAAEFQRIKENQGDELELRKTENLLRASLTLRNREKSRLQKATATIAAAQQAVKQGEAALKQLGAAAKRPGSANGKKKPNPKKPNKGKKK